MLKMLDDPDVTIIVPHLNDKHNLKICLASLMRQSFNPSRFEIVVADNGSSCDLSDIHRMLNNAGRVLSVRERGAGPARNAAVTNSKGRFLAFIDSDCIASEDWLASGLTSLQRSTIVGGRIAVSVCDMKAPSASEGFELVFAFDNENYIKHKNFSVTANLFATREVFEKVGPFRNDVSEDLEWGQRAKSLGFKISYDPSCLVSHPARPDWEALRKKWQRLVRESYALHRSRGLSEFRWVMLAIATLVSPLRDIFKIVQSDKLSGMQLKLKVIGILFRVRAFRFWHMIEMLRSLQIGKP
jgi:glycosyltransferase involved in cell wall biosynthesis